MSAAKQFSQSSIVPKPYQGKPADVFVALEYGAELGLQPMISLQNIYIVNGRPTLSAQVMAGLVKVQPDYMGMKIKSSQTEATVTVERKLGNGTIEQQTGTFTIAQAQAAGLTGKDNWKGYPQQMLEARALAFALKKAFPDLFAGISSKEEAEDLGEIRSIQEEATVTTTEPEKAAEKEPEPAAEPPKEPTEGEFSSLSTKVKAIFQSGFFTEAEQHTYRESFVKKGGKDITIPDFKAYVEALEKEVEIRKTIY
jgi:hypothetical protein